MDNCGECAELLQDGCEEIIGVCPESPVVRDYNAFTNKPSINGVTLVGNKTSDDLGITQQITEAVQAEAEARQTADEALQQGIDDEETARANADTALDGRITANATNIANEALARQNADNGLQSQIDAITSQSDVVDVVANYAALQAYDTSTLSDNDVIKVLDDETHEDALTYYRWSTTTQTWSYIGQEAPYYSKGQMDTKLAEKQDKLTAGANIQIQNGTISATDTTYTAGNGLNLNGTEFSADTDVLATKEDLESYYTKPEADNLLAPKLEAEVVAELPATGEEGKLYLTPKAHTTQTATGNPITATVTEEAGALESFQLDGDTFQQSYEGKNLFDIEQYSNALLRGGGSGVSLDKIDSRTLRATNRIEQSNNFCGIPVPNYTELLGKTVTVSGSVTRHDVTNTRIMFAWNTNNVSVFGQNLPLSRDGTFSLTQSIPASAPSGATGLLVVIYANGEGANGGVGSYVDWSDIQLEVGSSATSYEPFVGGTPSPNPEYPQPIQTVTGLQTVEIQGKNLFNGIVTKQHVSNTGVISSNSAWDLSEIIAVSPNTTYTVSWADSGMRSILILEWSGESFIKRSGTQGQTTYTFTTDSTTDSIRLNYNNTFGDTDFQIELGSTASDYIPYSKQTLPLDLGNIELNNLEDTYLDYIWKDGSDWKIRKNTNRFTFETRKLMGLSKQPLGFTYNTDNNPLEGKHIPLVGECSHFDVESTTTTWTALNKTGMNSGGALWFRTAESSQGDTRTIEEFGQWLVDAGVSFVYALETPTDTAITDQTLIAQLEAIRTASLQNGANTISNTATGSNLAGDMGIGYYGYNPRNRYDKWLWLDINNEYEQIGS